jgi:uncharacterized protein (TIGR01319 family)
MRVSAATAMEAGGAGQDALRAYAGRLAARPEFLPASPEDEQLDAALAGLCVGHACARHVGRLAKVYTPDGEVGVQTGRDLRKVARVIGSGGWLSRAAGFDPAPWFARQPVDARGRAVLFPQRFAYYRDEAGLFPLLANLARAHPRAAALAGVRMLKN